MATAAVGLPPSLGTSHITVKFSVNHYSMSTMTLHHGVTMLWALWHICIITLCRIITSLGLRTAGMAEHAGHAGMSWLGQMESARPRGTETRLQAKKI